MNKHEVLQFISKYLIITCALQIGWKTQCENNVK